MVWLRGSLKRIEQPRTRAGRRHRTISFERQYGSSGAKFFKFQAASSALIEMLSQARAGGCLQRTGRIQAEVNSNLLVLEILRFVHHLCRYALSQCQQAIAD